MISRFRKPYSLNVRARENANKNSINISSQSKEEDRSHKIEKNQ